jgi:hypothetical protein
MTWLLQAWRVRTRLIDLQQLILHRVLTLGESSVLCPVLGRFRSERAIGVFRGFRAVISDRNTEYNEKVATGIRTLGQMLSWIKASALARYIA